MTETVSALFDRYEDAQTAVNKLQSLGIDRAQISLVSNNSDNWYEGHRTRSTDAGEVGGDAAGGAGIGAMLGGAAGALTGLGLIAIPGLGPVVAAGWLASTAAGAAAGAVAGSATGGIIGAMTENGVPEEEANVYAEGVRRGGTLVTAHVPEGDVAAAQAILDENRRVDYQARGSAYRAAGWNRFDADAPPYTADEIARERQRYL
ncbi:hypothetical protein [Ancylobacter terrae]|uniref:hypothetical protein n=1 Tax=Ancylobacter sp. sgz301288 TaxID=3342077 RepID=UPI00385D11D4